MVFYIFIYKRDLRVYPFFTVLGKVIPTYGLCMAVGILLAACIVYYRAKKVGLDINSMIIIAACAVGGALVGAKLLYIAVSYDPKEILEDITQGRFVILAGSGLVFYGGLIGGAVTALLGLIISGELKSADKVCSAVVPAIPVGHAVGRIGCFLAGCCYGAEYDGIFAVTFPKAGVFVPVFPVQLLEAALNMVLFLVLLYFGRREKIKYELLYLYMILYSLERFLLEFLRGDRIRGFLQGFSTSQWISMGLLAVGSCVLLINFARERRLQQ